MTMPMRPYSMGYGYGMGQMGEEPGYFGSTDPGKELASTMLQARASKRADDEATALNKERTSIDNWRDEQAARDRIEWNARLIKMGATPSGAGGGGSNFQDGMPPATPGTRAAPRMGGGDRIPFGGSMGRPDTLNQVPDSSQTLHGRPPAFLSPGAFNPQTNQHNPPISLGSFGGQEWSMPSRESTQQDSANELLNSGLLPHLSPAAAMYLSQHPEHIAGLIAAERGRGGVGSFEDWRQRWDYETAHPHRNTEADKPEISLAGAMQDIDRTMPGRLTQAGRFGLAQRETSKGFQPQNEPALSTIDELARSLPDNHDPEKARRVFQQYGFSPATTDSIFARHAEIKSGAGAGGTPKPKGKGLFGSGIGPNFP